jgi:hypothetical protein
MAGVLRTIRREATYHDSVLSPAAFSDSDGEEEVNNSTTCTCTTCIQVVLYTGEDGPSLTPSLPGPATRAPPSSSVTPSPREDEPETLEESCMVGTIGICYSSTMQETGELEASQGRPPPTSSSPASLAVTPSGLASPSAPSPARDTVGTQSFISLHIIGFLVSTFPQAEGPSNHTGAEQPERKRGRSEEGGEAPEEGRCSQCRVSLSTPKIRFDSAVQYSTMY